MQKLRNRMDYSLRQFFRWRRRGFRPAFHPQHPLFQNLDGIRRDKALQTEARFHNDYHLGDLKANTNSGNYQENLFYLGMLETAFGQLETNKPLPETIHAADIGPSHWFYVQALMAFLKWYQADTPRNITLTGFEADAWRVYTDLYSRYDRATGYAGDLQGVAYIPEAFHTQPGSYDLIFLFFPFVFPSDHLDWGLPMQEFQPRQLLEAAWQSLRPGGRLMVVNQGAEEHQQESQNFAACGIPMKTSLRMDDLLFRYDLDRYIILSEAHA